MKKFEHESQRYEYPLTSASLVVDCGGFRGEFANEIVRKYGCNVIVYEPIFPDVVRANTNPEKVKVIPAGVGWPGIVSFGIQDNWTGLFSDSKNRQEVQLVALSDELANLKVDLLKLNIEGCEYQVLLDLIGSGVVMNCERIQAQFHDGQQWRKYGKRVISMLEQTHPPEWGEDPLLWISYVRK